MVEGCGVAEISPRGSFFSGMLYVLVHWVARTEL